MPPRLRRRFKSFVPEQPLFSGRRGSPGSGGALLPDGGDARADAVHVIATLWDADQLAVRGLSSNWPRQV